MYSNHRLNIPNLNTEILCLWELGQHRFQERWAELKINDEIGNRLQLGANLIFTEGRRFRPAKGNDLADQTFWASVMPTSWDGTQPYDLMAITPKGYWLRLGVERWLGDPAEGPYHAKVLAWLRNGGEGSCWIGGR